MLNNKFESKLLTVYSKLLKNYLVIKNKKSIKPKELKAIIGSKCKIFEGYEQQDSHEFLIILLDNLEEEFKKMNINIISDLFDCKMKTIIRSLESNEYSEKIEPVRFLSVPIPSNKNVTIEDCFIAYIEKEQLDGDYLWETPSYTREIASKITYIVSFPKYLIFQLKRYNDRSQKIGTKIKIDENWESEIFPDDISYKLKGFIIQRGSLNGGHYMSYVQVNEKWFLFNDETVNEVNSSSAINAASEAYLVFYIRNDKVSKRKIDKIETFDFSDYITSCYNTEEHKKYKKYRLNR